MALTQPFTGCVFCIYSNRMKGCKEEALRKLIEVSSGSTDVRSYKRASHRILIGLLLPNINR